MTDQRKSRFSVSRRGFLAGGAAVASARVVPQIATRGGGRRVLTVIYDKALGAMRAVDRIVP